MSVWQNFTPPPQLALDLQKAGLPLSGEIGEAFARYETALGRLAFLQLANALDPEALAEGPTMAGTPAQVRAMAESAMTYLRTLIASAQVPDAVDDEPQPRGVE